MKGGASVPSVPGAAGLASAAAATAGGLAGAAASLPADVKAAFDNVASGAAFAVSFAQGKVEPALLKETKPEPATDTANTETVDAAAARVVGNEKVPSVSSSGGSGAAKATVISALEFLQNLAAQAESLDRAVQALNAESSITQEQWNTVNGELQVIRATFNNKVNTYQTDAVNAVNAVPDSSSEKALLSSSVQKFQSVSKQFVTYAIQLKKDIADLANKIAT
jgi:hypothetical protein